MKKKAPKSKAELEKVQEEHYNSIPEGEKNENHKEDFEKLLTLAVTKKASPIKKKD